MSQAVVPVAWTRRLLGPKWLGRRDSAIIAFSGFLFAAIVALRVASPDSADASLVLFVLPIAICAFAFGVRGGLAAALLAIAIVGVDLASTNDLSAMGVAAGATAYLLVGGLLGRFADEKRLLEAKLDHHFELSSDLFCTWTYDGYFEDLNPAWERTLGFPVAELCSRPIMDFIHPDDRKRTTLEARRMMDTGVAMVHFRNRYLTAGGEYRWLNWMATSVPPERRVYATARDITDQQDARGVLQDQSHMLERRVRERTQALEESRLETLQRLAFAAEFRDDATKQHTQRVGRTAALIAQRLGLPDDAVALIRRAAPLHDIGKVGIPDAILLKPGRLTPAEFDVMKHHAEIGARILADGKSADLQLAQRIALTHHERWDGGGYPDGHSGSNIPLSGRIVAVADVFDALTHERPYKEAWSVEKAVAEIDANAGTQFDPRVVEAFGELDRIRLRVPVAEYDLDLPPPPPMASVEDLLGTDPRLTPAA